ncbi:MAG: hypothetical protein OHK0023_17930 [Anaerolineae bacterium]
MFEDDEFVEESLGDESDQLNQVDEKRARAEAERAAAPTLQNEPLFQALFKQSIDPNDVVLNNFAEHVIGKLSDEFATSAAKGGAFFQQKVAEGAQNTSRYSLDQNLRAHLVNGVLPSRKIGQLLYAWGAPKLREFEAAERLFMAGFVMHDYTKIEAVKDYLKERGFTENESPSERLLPTIVDIFRAWGEKLGMVDFLAPIGGLEANLYELIYVALNTQRLWGTAHTLTIPYLSARGEDVRQCAVALSHLADLLAYVAPTPRDLVAHPSLNKALAELARNREDMSQPYARFVYHHVAENRGILLNLIHNAVLRELTHERRVPILYAPSGVVYLEGIGAPPMPDLDALTEQIVASVRQKAGDALIATGKGAKRGSLGLATDPSYDDFFDLPEYIRRSPNLVTMFIKNNKSGDRLAPVRGWLGAEQVPVLPADPKDARLDQFAEWAGLMETKLKDRLPTFDLVAWLLGKWQLDDLAETFQALRSNPEARKGGIKYWWFWAAAQLLARRPLSPEQVTAELEELSNALAAEMPEDLPASARANDEIWIALSDYIRRVLTLNGDKRNLPTRGEDLARYINGKGGRGAKAVCAMCGAAYETRKQVETAVAFQPGVYSGRIKLGSSENKRSSCAMCTLEQLLRQLFVSGQDYGRSAEGQRVRYLSFYPTYFFTTETLYMLNRFCQRFDAVRLSNKELDKLLRQVDLRDTTFWQRLEEFLIKPDPAESRQVLRYRTQFESTFLMLGLRVPRVESDTESWIMPAFLALLMPILLDVKVVASETSVPLLLEAAELRETVWFDGAHAAIQVLIGNKPLNVDEIPYKLGRLVAAYLIHLETESECAPPKDNWRRFIPIANALMESPLYVFHYLKKQERDDDKKQAGSDKLRRYIGYAEDFFTEQGDDSMTHAKRLVELYRGFYRAKNIANNNSILRPISVVSDALLVADARLFDTTEALIEVAYGELYRFMQRVASGAADGRLPKGIPPKDREDAMRAFCTYFVTEIFVGIYRKDVSALRGKQLNLLRSACEVIYRDMQAQEWRERGKDADETDDLPEAAEDSSN